jgi:hypothetical protein
MKKAFDENLPRMKPHLRLQTDPTASTFLPTEPDPEERGHAAPSPALSIDVPHGAAEALLSAAEGLAGELADARARGDRLEMELLRAHAELDRALAEVRRLLHAVGGTGGVRPVEPLVAIAREHPDDRVRAAAVVACLRFGTRSERLALFGDSIPPAKPPIL